MEEKLHNEENELNEEQLEGVAGGGTKNRYDPNECKNRTTVRKDKCVYDVLGTGFTINCDHYRRTGNGYKTYIHSCAMNAFPPYET